MMKDQGVYDPHIFEQKIFDKWQKFDAFKTVIDKKQHARKKHAN